MNGLRFGPVLGLFLLACGAGPSDAGVSGDATTPDAVGSVDAADLDAGWTDTAGPCLEGSRCDPIPIATFPFHDERDTTRAPSDELDAYACAPSTDESGAEIIYALTLSERSRVIATVDDVSGDSVDVDLHLLTAIDAAACTARDNRRLDLELEAGAYYLVVDTWVNSAGVPLPGPYRLDVSAAPLAARSCATLTDSVATYWAACDSSIDCYEAIDPVDGARRRFLRMPAQGPVVREAHLVTVDEPFPNAWPASFTDQIDRHYQISEAATGYSMTRREPWAPAGEGGSNFGQGATGNPVPVVEEAWYINMYWRHRPPRGTRMIVTNPANGRSVVAAAGFETGPGSNTAVAGVAEEIHHYLGTSHREVLVVGFAVDNTLPYGPITCR
ncbi:MAG: hypothetical protein IT384_00970 [Deltaproteobacteria bacterium]|nr:hypothetical protein [Deltaproteobacteria bacterium]